MSLYSHFVIPGYSGIFVEELQESGIVRNGPFLLIPHSCSS